jgi:hypothetical protein
VLHTLLAEAIFRGWLARGLTLVALAALAALVLTLAPAQADTTCTVTSLDDSGEGTLCCYNDFVGEPTASDPAINFLTNMNINALSGYRAVVVSVSVLVLGLPLYLLFSGFVMNQQFSDRLRRYLESPGGQQSLGKGGLTTIFGIHPLVLVGLAHAFLN